MEHETDIKRTQTILEKYELSMQAQLFTECEVMTEYALTNGMKLPEHLANIIKSPSFQNVNKNNNALERKNNSCDGFHALIVIHGQLVDMISPVKPQTLVFMKDEGQKKGCFKFISPVRFIRRMTLISIFSMAAMITLSLCESVDGDPKRFSLFESHGKDLLLNELFLLSAAAIGASFSALFSANYYLQKGTFNPSYETSYWIKFVLGLLGGIIIATLIPIEQAGTEALKGFGKPILALLGGFSAQVVYRILNRLTKALESLFRGDETDTTMAREETIKARIAGQAVQNKLVLSTKLAHLRGKIETSNDAEEIKKGFDQIQSELTSPGT
ncbi:MAG: hypothetical protein GY874_01950 [Desulfobacteraceae bacterium]|nr:hypothetical protein [Desulfobacteraceae bacterium]